MYTFECESLSVCICVCLSIRMFGCDHASECVSVFPERNYRVKFSPNFYTSCECKVRLSVRSKTSGVRGDHPRSGRRTLRQ